MANSRDLPSPRGDEAELFRQFNDELMRDVSRHVSCSSAQTIEDACAFAWTQFLEVQPDRGRNWQGWLFTTAKREAWLLERGTYDHEELNGVSLGEYGEAHGRDVADELQLRGDVEDAMPGAGRLR